MSCSLKCYLYIKNILIKILIKSSLIQQLIKLKNKINNSVSAINNNLKDIETSMNQINKLIDGF